MAFLALRHTSPPGKAPGVFAALTRARLITRYPHSGIVIDGTLYESTFKHGVKPAPFVPDGWDLFKITNVDDATLLQRFKQVEGSSYDWFSLFAFVLPFRVRVAKWFYCYELCEFMLTGIVPRSRVTPETLLTRI